MQYLNSNTPIDEACNEDVSYVLLTFYFPQNKKTGFGFKKVNMLLRKLCFQEQWHYKCKVEEGMVFKLNYGE